MLYSLTLLAPDLLSILNNALEALSDLCGYPLPAHIPAKISHQLFLGREISHGNYQCPGSKANSKKTSQLLLLFIIYIHILNLESLQ
jgi:hypothetical protein